MTIPINKKRRKELLLLLEYKETCTEMLQDGMAIRYTIVPASTTLGSKRRDYLGT
jgi:hypothetical protein